MSDRHQQRVLEDMMSLLCGEFLGSGISRRVYTHATDPDLVVKVSEPGHHANIVEHRIWEEVRDRKAVADWLAPCVRLSTDGLVLLQRRVLPARPSELPARLPNFLQDIKIENFGFLDGRIVCCDYALSRFSFSTRESRVDWS